MDEGSSLRVVYELEPHDATPPTWPEPDTRLVIKGEEIIPPPAGSTVAIRIEDPFRNVDATPKLRSPDSVEVDLPHGVCGR